MKLFSHYFNRPKRLENLDLLGFRNQIAYPYYLRVTEAPASSNLALMLQLMLILMMIVTMY